MHIPVVHPLIDVVPAPGSIVRSTIDRRQRQLTDTPRTPTEAVTVAGDDDQRMTTELIAAQDSLLLAVDHQIVPG